MATLHVKAEEVETIEVSPELKNKIDNTIATIKDQGYCIVPNFLTPEQVDDVKYAFENELPVIKMKALGDNTGKTIRGHNLLAKTRSCDYIFLHPFLRGVVDGMLGSMNREPQINITTLFNLYPGANKQQLHRDDNLWPIQRPRPHSLLCNCVIAISDFDIENGATHLIPYSHKPEFPELGATRESQKKIQNDPTQIQAVMKAGSILFWEGSMFHGGGANVSKDRQRLGFFISHVVNYLRPQEMNLLGIPRSEVQKMPKRLQRLCGYNLFSYGVGGQIDFRDPLQVLRDGQVVNPKAEVDNKGYSKM